MPKFRVSNPSGEQWDINVPDGATSDDAVNYFKRQEPTLRAQRYGGVSDSQPASALSPSGLLPAAWQATKDTFAGAIPGTPQSNDPNRSVGQKLASLAVSPIALPGAIASKVLGANEEAADTVAGQGASWLSQSFPGLPAAIPAGLATVGAIAGNPGNWAPGAEAAYGPAEKAIADGGFENYLNPAHFAEQARSIAKVPGQIKEGYQALKNGIQGFQDARTAAEMGPKAPVAAPAPAAAPSASGLPDNNAFEQGAQNITNQRHEPVAPQKPLEIPPKRQLPLPANPPQTPPKAPEVPVLGQRLPDEGGAPIPASQPAQPADQFPRQALRDRRAAATTGNGDLMAGMPTPAEIKAEGPPLTSVANPETGGKVDVTAKVEQKNQDFEALIENRIAKPPVNPVEVTHRFQGPDGKIHEVTLTMDAEDLDENGQLRNRASAPGTASGEPRPFGDEQPGIPRPDETGQVRTAQVPGVEANQAPSVPGEVPGAAKAAPAAAGPAPVEAGNPIRVEAEGRQTVIQTASGQHEAQYKLAALEDLKPSHDPAKGFAPNPDFQDNVQPRDYRGNKNHQAAVLSNASPDKFDPAGQIFDNGSTPITGPPIITADGTVLGGNGRTMSMLVAQGNPETAARMAEAVRTAAPGMGIDPAAVDKMLAEGKTPVIVRQLANEPQTVDEARNIASELNQGITKEGDPAEKAFTRGSNISNGGMSKIAEAIGDREIDAALATQQGTKDVTKALIEDGALSANEVVGMTNPKTGTLTNDGIQQIKNALVARITGSVDMVRNVPPEIQGKLLKSVGDLTKIEASTPEFSLKAKLQEALAHIVDQAGGMVKKEDWHKAQDLLRNVSDDARSLVKCLTASIKESAERFATYAEACPKVAEAAASEQEKLFEDEISTKYTPEQAFKQAFESTATKNGGGIYLNCELIPGVRSLAKGVASMAKVLWDAPYDKAIAQTPQEFLGMSKEFQGPTSGWRFLIRQYLPVSDVMPRVAFEYRRAKELAVTTSQKYVQAMFDATEPIKGNWELNKEFVMKLEGRMDMAEGNKAVSESAQKVRGILDQYFEMTGKAPEHYRQGFYPHEGPGLKPWEMHEIGLDTGMMSPGETPHFRARTSENSPINYDVRDSLSRYFTRTTRDLVTERLQSAWSDRIDTMKLSDNEREYWEALKKSMSTDPRNQNNLDTLLDNMINRSARILGKTPPGVGVSRQMTDAFLGHIYAAQLGLALKTPFKIVGQVGNTFAQVGGKAFTGFARYVFSPEARQAYKDSGYPINSIMAEMSKQAEILSAPQRAGFVDRMLGAYHTGVKLAMKPVAFAENFIRGSAYTAGILKGSELGYEGDQLQQFAKGMVDKSQFTWGKGEVSPYLDSSIGRMVSMFTHYPVHQLTMQYNMLAEGHFKQLARLMAFQGAVIGAGAATGLYSADKFFGWTPLSDVTPQLPTTPKGQASQVWQRPGNLEFKALHTPIIGGKAIGDLPLPLGPLASISRGSPPVQALATILHSEAKVKDGANVLANMALPKHNVEDDYKLLRSLYTGREVQWNPKFGRWQDGKQLSFGNAINQYLDTMPQEDLKERKAALATQIKARMIDWLGKTRPATTR